MLLLLRNSAPVAPPALGQIRYARSGIARSGATRSNHYVARTVLVIAGTERHTSVIWESLSVTEALNDEPDTARFTVKPNAGFTPLAGQSVVIGLGSVDNPEFGGQIATVTHRWEHGVAASLLFFDVSCLDYGPLFDRVLVTTAWTNVSATTIAQDVVTRFTLGFTANRVEYGLPTIAYFAATNEPPSAVLRRLVNLIGGGFYIDPQRNLHLFGFGGEATSHPQPMTNTNPTLKTFRHAVDATQLRNSVIVEGRRTTCPIYVNAGATDIPMLDGTVLEPETANGLARLGLQRLQWGGRFLVSPETYVALDLPPGGTSTVHTPAAPQSTTLRVALAPNFLYGTPGWARLNGQYFFYTGVTETGSYLEFTGIPALGFGSLPTAGAVGDSVALSDSLTQIPEVGVGSIEVSQPADSDLVILVHLQDTGSQATLAALEGGDGIHQHHVSDARLTYPGAAARGTAELADFAEALVRARWETMDLNAKPGRSQVVSITGTPGLSTTLTITDVQLTWPTSTGHPWRSCEGSTVKVAKLLDVILTDEG